MIPCPNLVNLGQSIGTHWYVCRNSESVLMSAVVIDRKHFIMLL